VISDYDGSGEQETGVKPAEGVHEVFIEPGRSGDFGFESVRLVPHLVTNFADLVADVIIFVKQRDRIVSSLSVLRLDHRRHFVAGELTAECLPVLIDDRLICGGESAVAMVDDDGRNSIIGICLFLKIADLERFGAFGQPGGGIVIFDIAELASEGTDRDHERDPEKQNEPLGSPSGRNRHQGPEKSLANCGSFFLCVYCLHWSNSPLSWIISVKRWLALRHRRVQKERRLCRGVRGSKEVGAAHRTEVQG
jgi:hypothetical protein